MMPTRAYPAIIERGASGYGVFFPDLPGCTSAGDTVEDAARNAGEALQGHLEVSLEYGDTLPPATGLDALPREPEVAEASRRMIEAEISEAHARLEAANARLHAARAAQAGRRERAARLRAELDALERELAEDEAALGGALRA